MFFDVFQALCNKKGVSCKRAAEDIGLSNSITTKWKKTGATPNTDTLQRIADYFGVSINYLLEKEDEDAGRAGRPMSREDLKVALFNGRGEVTDAMLDEVFSFVDYIVERENKKRKDT